VLTHPLLRLGRLKISSAKVIPAILLATCYCPPVFAGAISLVDASLKVFLSGLSPGLTLTSMETAPSFANGGSSGDGTASQSYGFSSFDYGMTLSLNSDDRFIIDGSASSYTASNGLMEISNTTNEDLIIQIFIQRNYNLAVQTTDGFAYASYGYSVEWNEELLIKDFLELSCSGVSCSKTATLNDMYPAGTFLGFSRVVAANSTNLITTDPYGAGSVPVPGTIWLLGVGLVAMTGVRRQTIWDQSVRFLRDAFLPVASPV